MFKIQQVHSHEDMVILGQLKMELMQYHLKYSTQLGINDKELLNYNLEQALSTVSLRDSFILYVDNTPVGMAQVEEQNSSIDDIPILFVHNVYIKPEHQNRGLGIVFLRYLCHKYNKRIECECWYDLPVSKLYQKAGFKPLVTRYMLPTSSKFYDSDQN